MNLEKSERFQKEYQKYKTKIDTIENTTKKNEAEALLKSLVSEVKRINDHHNRLLTSGTLSDMVQDSRHRIVELRKKLEKIIK